MKKISTLVFLLTSFMVGSTEKEPIKSTITDVTVYMQGAQIYRKANFSIKPGVTELIIDGICPTIDPKSLQVKATGNLVIIDSKYLLFYPKPEENKSPEGLPLKVRNQIHAIEDSMHLMGYDIQEIQDEIDVLNATKSILANNGAIRGNGKVNDSIQLLKQAVEYYALKMNELNKQLLKLNRRKTDKNHLLEAMTNRLNQLRNFQQSNNLKEAPKGPIHRLVVTVSSNEIVAGKLSFSYLVSQAGWTPLYDLKSEATAGKINLTYKAQVYQNTGVNWDDIRMSISTNNPYLNKTKPALHPWYIDYQIAYNDKMLNNGAFNTAPGSISYSDALETNKIKKENLDDNAIKALSSESFVQLVDHMISVEFKIDLPYTILSNNEKHMVLVKNQDIAADFKHFTIPKLDASVYLVAQISKLDELQLVPAKANIFFEGTYMGETYIDPTNMEDTLSLSLGKDPNILVKRVLVKKDCKEKIIGNQRERLNAFNIEVKSMKSTAIKLIIQDQVPMSQNADIVVEATELDHGSLNSATGIVQWELDLKPKDTKNIKFGYRVKYNKDQNIAAQ